MEKQIFWWYCIRNNNNNTTVMEGSAKATSVQTEVGKWMYLSPGCKIWSNHTILVNYGIHLLVIYILDCSAICLNTIHLVILHYQWKFLPFLNVMSTVSYTCRIDFPAKKNRIFLCFNLYVSVFYVMRMIAYATQLLMMPCYGNNIVVNFLLELFYTHFVYFILLCKNTQHKKRTRNGDEDADHQLNFWNKIYMY